MESWKINADLIPGLSGAHGPSAAALKENNLGLVQQTQTIAIFITHRHVQRVEAVRIFWVKVFPMQENAKMKRKKLFLIPTTIIHTEEFSSRGEHAPVQNQ